MNRTLIVAVLVSLIVGIGAGYAIYYGGISRLRSEVSNLQSEISTLTTDYNNLDGRYNNLEAKYNELLSDYESLNESYFELSQQYEDLLFHYNLINGPVSNFTTVEDLQITIATDRTTYYYKDPVSGNLTITYLNGTAFEGSFQILVGRIGVGIKYFPSQSILGFAEFDLSPPVFQYGPGNYTIRIGNLHTADGYWIYGGHSSEPFVQVEAK